MCKKALAFLGLIDPLKTLGQHKQIIDRVRFYKTFGAMFLKLALAAGSILFYSNFRMTEKLLKENAKTINADFVEQTLPIVEVGVIGMRIF